MTKSRRKGKGKRLGEGPMPDALAHFFTWTTYGTWLPGDGRGWVVKGRGFRLPEPRLAKWCEKRLVEPACYLDFEQRALVEQTVEKHCKLRNWKLHAVNARTAHVHAVITAKHDPEIVREQLKAWCTRKLNELNVRRGAPDRSNWWTEKGSIRSIGDEESLEAVVHYVLFGQ